MCDVLKDHIATLASEGQLCIETEAKKPHGVATNLVQRICPASSTSAPA
jgi:hypothetical protein